MGRAMIFAFFMICISMSMNLIQNFNICYERGQTDETQGGFDLNLCPDEAGVGHAAIPFDWHPLWDARQNLRDENGTVIQPNTFSSYMNGISNSISYKQAPSGLADIFGFFSWVLGGIRFIVNTFFTPIAGIPTFLTQFYIPYILAAALGTITFIIQLIGIYEFASGRSLT